MSVVSAAVLKLIAGGIENWSAYLIRWPKIPLRDVVRDWDAVVEAFVRRNALVHAAGRVDADYLRRLPQSYPRPVLGSSVHCTHEYLLSAVDRFGAVGAALPHLLFAKLRPGVLPADTAVRPVVVLLERGRFADAEALAGVFLDLLDVTLEDRDILQVNRWMAIREQGGDVSNEVEQWAPVDEEPR